ncbi:MAG: transporter, partial [Pedobacter sp.]
MTFKKILFLFACLFALPLMLFAQQKNDSLQVKEFSLQALEELLMAHHPVIKQAQLLSETAKAQILTSLGGFDPALRSSYQEKYFGNTTYYSNWNNELKIPLWLAGADLKIDYDRNVGPFTNSQYATSPRGLSGVGISVPLGQGLLIDSRRNTLRQARAMLGYAEAEQVKQINTIWFTAVQDYWDWYYAFRQYELLREGVGLAEKRFQAISMQTVLGDAPSIDSVEAAITVQERQIELEKYKVDLQNSRLLLSNHLWNESRQPVELPDYAIPATVDSKKMQPNPEILNNLLALAQEQHPDLLKLESRNLQLQIEESYRKELLKPRLNLEG